MARRSAEEPSSSESARRISRQSLAAQQPAAAQRLAEAALDDSLRSVCDLVYARIQPNRFCARSRDGEVVFDRTIEADDWAFPTVSLTGNDPSLGVSGETYPHAREHIAQLFDSAHAPDLVIQHHPAHSYGGNIGQHGSLARTQATAPFIAAGPGIQAGTFATESMQMIDVAPSIASLLGVPVHPNSVGRTGSGCPDGLMARQDGAPNHRLITPGGARRVMVFLLDGLNPDALDMAINTGRAPTIAALRDGGASLGEGLIASAPTATLANHTSANTGVHPGRTGVLHHSWFDRSNQARPNLLSVDEMFHATVHVHPEVETIHEAIHRMDPAAFTTASYEFCDRGADASSFAGVRQGRLPALVPADQLGDYHTEWMAASGEYSFMSSVDERSMLDTISWWDGSNGNPLPTFSWVSLSLTDEAGHVSGPMSEMTLDAVADSDRRMAAVLRAVERAGALDDTTIFIMADHGMAQSDPSNDRPYDDVLAATGVEYVDVGDGFIYVT